jgi:hypothetical protein
MDGSSEIWSSANCRSNADSLIMVRSEKKDPAGIAPGPGLIRVSVVVLVIVVVVVVVVTFGFLVEWVPQVLDDEGAAVVR